MQFRPSPRGAEITPESRRLAIADDGTPFSTPFDVFNEGRTELTVSETTAPGRWSVEPGQFTLAPGARQTLTLSHPGADRPGAGQLVFRSNDPDEPTTRVELRIGSNRLFVGDEAPDFAYPSATTGETVRLSALRGKVVVLSYFGYF